MQQDSELISEVQAGNPQAFERLVTEYQDMVARFVFRIIPSAEDREEVCQDVFVKAYFKISQFKGEAKFSTWLFQIAYNTAISFKRKRVISQVPLEDHDIADVHRDELEQDDVSREIAAQLNRLSLEERSVVTLFYMQDMSVEDISHIVNRPNGTVKSILFRARGKLQNRMQPELLGAGA